MSPLMTVTAPARPGVVAPPVLDERFTGRWRFDPSSPRAPPEIEKRTLTATAYVVGDGKDIQRYAVDGRFHTLRRGGYCSAVAVRRYGLDRVRFMCRSTKTGGYDEYMSTAPDGRHLSIRTVILGRRSQKTIVTRKLQVRVEGASTAGITGIWRTARQILPEDGSLDMVIRTDGKRFSSFSVRGVGYDVPVGAAPAPIIGDTTGGSVTVSVAAPGVVTEHDLYGGVEKGLVTMRLAPDHKTIAVEVRDVKAGVVRSYAMRRIGDRGR